MNRKRTDNTDGLSYCCQTLTFSWFDVQVWIRVESSWWPTYSARLKKSKKKLGFDLAADFGSRLSNLPDVSS